MDLKICVAFIVLLFGICHGAATKSFHGYQVLRAKPTSQAQYQALVNLYDEGRLDFWAGPSKTTPTDIMVDPSERANLLAFFAKHSIQHNVFIENVGRIITEQQIRSPRNETGMNWENYQTLETIYNWIDDMVLAFPNLITVSTIGTSTEGRDLKVLKLSTGGSDKTAFWIDATIHAREWISTATITYIINELVNNQAAYADLYEVVDFYILPVINPDGYVYSHETDRMWRKTRSNYGTTCYGVDANRNFGFQWGGPGSSGIPCAETYRGPEAYSEPEALAVKNYIEGQREQNNVQWDAFITIHSYSQLWMTPYGYTQELPEDYDELKALGDAAVAALTSHYGTHYQVGNAAGILYESSGSSRDWAKGEGGFRNVYTIELRDTGEYGFLLPPEQIIPTAIETWAGIQVIARSYAKN